ncbi:Unannotated [Lentimonas sp. CC4]|nr:Unannotated [Lentimonas sp. CC4]CAA6683591.1 Unannotated [Lentimonas sp. CC6]CAA7077353.1 Unannotated [Lentimonas sp. CC4]CAA7170128.1 Unannotated [Lentimonas sp. CC21]CAA7182481.1 Unannotated [Lentimonas sp. CC8]
MNHVMTVLLQLIVALGLLVVLGCRPSTELEPTIDYLLPCLQTQSVDSIELSSAEGRTLLVRKDAGWWVDDPVDYPAATTSIQMLVRNLTDVEIGKRMKVAFSDLGKLGLESDSGSVTVTLGFESSESVTLIFGDLSYPKDMRAGHVVGMGFLARRYVRVIRSSSDEVFLVPISLVDLTSASGFWTDHSFCRIPSFKRMDFINADSVTHTFYREQMFGSLFHHVDAGEAQRIAPNQFAAFEAFLKQGRCRQVGISNPSDSLLATTEGVSVLVEDFSGNSYRFRFGRPVAPSETEIRREALQAGFFSDGMASSLVPFTVDVSSVAMEMNYLEQQLNAQNLARVNRLKGRIAYVALEECESLFRIMEGVE